MGGEEALTTAAVDARIHAVVNEGGWSRVFEDVRPLADRDLLQAALLPMYRVWLTSTEFMTSARPPMPLAHAMAQISPRPVLLIAASEEPEIFLMSRLHSVAPQSTELWQVPDTPHTQGLYTHPDEWQARVLGFLDRVLVQYESARRRAGNGRATMAPAPGMSWPGGARRVQPGAVISATGRTVLPAPAAGSAVSKPVFTQSDRGCYPGVSG